jgi:hypothetical protein
MSKVYLFAVMLLAASFTGCIEGGDELEKSTSPDEEKEDENDEEEETLKPVGTDNATNQPPLVTAGIWEDDDDFMYIDEDTMIGDKYLYVSWSAVDVDGTIANAGFDIDLDMQIDVGVGSDSGTIIDSAMNSDYFPGALSVPLNQGWNFERLEFSEDDDLYCALVMHRTFAFVAVDDDGASSAQLIHYVFPEMFDGDHMDDYAIEVLGISDDDADWVTGETSDCPEPYIPPAITFFVQEGSDGVYHVDVIQVSEPRPLEDYSFYLKDETGSTYVGQGHGFGEVAMQIVGGEEHGIDMAYGGDDEQLQNRATNVSNDDGSAYPVHFNDNDRDSKLSAGDQFLVYGSGNAAEGPASDNWRLDIQYDYTGDIVGSAVML